MPIAKEQIKIGFTVVANPGAYVSQSGVDEYGWGDKVEKGADYVAETPETTPARKVAPVKAKATE